MSIAIIDNSNNQLGYENNPFTAPLSVQVTNQSDGTPAPNVVVYFVDTSDAADYGSTIVSPQVTTDSNGKASTVVIAPGKVGLNNIQITAEIADSDTLVVFSLETASASIGSKYKIVNQHGSSGETGGQPFTLSVELTNINTGEVITTFSGTLDLVLNWTTTNSWMNIAPSNTSSQTVSCTFNQGMCVLPGTFILTDDRTPASVVVGDTSYQNVTGALNISVHKGAATSLVIATTAGGPANGASALGATTSLSLPATSTQYFAAEVDLAGNYVGDSIAANTTWSVSTGPLATDGFGGTSFVGQSSVTYTNATNKACSGTLSFTDSAVNGATASTAITVNPGTAAQLSVSTQNANSEYAGMDFSILAFVEDAYGNRVTDYTATPQINFELVTQNALPNYPSGGCSRFYEEGNSTYDNFFGPTSCSPGTIATGFMTNETVSNGVLNSIMHVIVPSEIAQNIPQITVISKDPNTGIAISGHDSALLVNPSAADHVNIYSAIPGSTSSEVSICYMYMLNQPASLCKFNPSNPDSSGKVVVGSSLTFYAYVEDKGGNILGNVSSPATATWQGIGAWSTSNGATWTTGSDGSSNPDVTFTAGMAGSGGVLVTVPSMSCNGAPCQGIYYGTSEN